MLNYSLGLDGLFHALADPTRRSMVERLADAPATVSELCRPKRMTMSAVMQHLRVLETCGLVRSEKRGRVRTCRVNSDALNAAQTWIADRRADLERRVDNLESFLKKRP